MLKYIKKVLKNILTGKDNTTEDLVKVLTFLGCIFTFILVMFKVESTLMYAFGTVYSAIMTAGGVTVKIKETTEPLPKIDTPLGG